MLSKFDQVITAAQFKQVQARPYDIGAAFRRRRRASDFVVVGGRVKHLSGRSGGEQPLRGSWGCALAADKRKRLFERVQRSMSEQCELLIRSAR